MDDFEEVAVIGMAGRFPGAKNLAEFWQNLKDGIEAISFFSDDELIASGINPAVLNDPQYVKAGAVLEGIEMFDASFFGFSPREAEMMDPQIRLFLETAWEALEDAGYDSKRYNGLIGVYGGTNISTYLLSLLTSNHTLGASANIFQILTMNDKDYLSTRVSYHLSLTGPSLTVQTACSTSLVAVHLACQSLLNGECDMALAGGSSIQVPQKIGYYIDEEVVHSPDGHCRAFDAKAQGTINGNGVGIVVLKRLTEALADRDHIYAVIKGSAINNDGSSKIGFTAPGIEGQVAVITEAMAIARVEPETIIYIEAHGTGTPLGDPIEVAALTKAFRAYTQASGFCALGSVKTNIGHLSVAAGIAGLIKTVLALKHKMIPPSLHFEEPNPEIDFKTSPVYVNTKLAQWEANGTPGRAGVSSFGIGGTNAHVILEEAPVIEVSGASRSWQALVLSAKTATALQAMAKNLATYLKENPQVNLADVAYTLQVGRRELNHRGILICRDHYNAISALESLDPERVFTGYQETRDRAVVFMFPGYGTQYVNMGLELYQHEPVFQEALNRCVEILKSYLDFDLRDILYPSVAFTESQLSDKKEIEAINEQLSQASIALPALFAVEYALAKLWMAWGVSPQAMIGHSHGEYVAACLAGVFSLEDALMLVASRGKLIQESPPGAMLSISLPVAQISPFLEKGASLAAINGPSLCVISGPSNIVDSCQNQLMEQGVNCRRLHTSHAFHSAMVEPILNTFSKYVEQVKLQPPTIPYLSNVTGTWITDQEATDPHYWVKHLRQTVRFAEGVTELWKESDKVFLEVGPRQTLSPFVRQQQPDNLTTNIIFGSIRHPQDQRLSDLAFLLTTLGKLWLAGVSINWAGFYANERRYRLSLPPYPFERRNYWLEPKAYNNQDSTWLTQVSTPDDQAKSTLFSSHQRPNLLTAYVAPRNELEQNIAIILEELLGIEKMGIHDDFFESGGHSLMATQFISRLREIYPIELSLQSIFEMPTIAKLAEVIQDKLIEKLEMLSEEEVQRLL